MGQISSCYGCGNICPSWLKWLKTRTSVIVDTILIDINTGLASKSKVRNRVLATQL